ncbi:MAG: DEAD/DEAH box helicase [Candidatus Heimdallarchaeota archaeon]
MNIEDLPIPQLIKAKLIEDGIKTLYPPQIDAVNKGLFKENNLVVAIPTASGKTLVALLACIRATEETGLKTLYLSPLRALAYEKYLEFRSYLNLINRRTILLTGDYDTEDSNVRYADVIIATNEKIDSAIRHQAKWISKIGLIITDEIHLINDTSRGPTLEVVIAQLRKVCDAQIIALSATIKNADEIARWLEAELVSSDWRPVKLNEGVLHNRTITYLGERKVTIPERYKNSFNNFIHYILKQKSQALIFATTRKMAESTARSLASFVLRSLDKNELVNLNKAANKILNTGEQTKQSRGLAELVRKGVSYHHAGLSPAQRRLVERNFKQGYIKMLSATPTLAAGVNLPARYVIIKSIYRYDVTLGSYPIPVLEFKQQSGRAGRPQYDTEGDAIVIAKNEYDAEGLYHMYIEAETEDIESKIATEPALRRIVLGQIATENSQTLEELEDFMSQTFYGYQQDPASLSSIINTVLKFLREEGLLIQDPDYLIATGFGKRVSQLYIDPLSAIVIRKGLQSANTMADQLLTDISFLHLVCSTPDVRFITVRKDDQINLINFISNHEDEFVTSLPESSFDLELFMSQLKTALILQDWVSETPEDAMLDRYNVGSGDVYSVVSNAEWLLYATSELAKLLKYSDIAKKTSVLHNRVVNGIKNELVDLVQIPGIGRVRGRALFSRGYQSQEILKKTEPKEILKVPGFGKELVKSIYTFLLQEDFSEEVLSSFPEDEGDEIEETTISQPQKLLDDFL